MKILKRIISLLSIIILIIGVCGCMNQGKEKVTNDPEKVKSQIIGFLEKKYGKEFVPISLLDNTYPSYQDKLWVYPKGGDKETEKFFAIGKMEEGEYTIGDTYFCQLIGNEYEGRVQEIAKGFFPKYKIQVEFGGNFFPNEFDSNSTLQDVINSGVKYNPTVYIKVASKLGNVEQFDKNTDLFAQKMAECKLQGSLIIYYLSNDNIDINVSDIDENSLHKRRDIVIKEDFSIKNYN